MLSRRSVRIKVMQLLYSISRDEGLSKDQLIKEYWKRIEETYEMLLFNLFLIENIAKISAEDYEKRKGKHLPTEQDKLFLPLLWENDKIRSLAKHTKLHKVYQKVGFNAKVDQDHFRSIYSEFSKTETYTDAIGKTLNSGEILELLLELYRFCLLYTSDAADERSSVDLGGRRTINKKNSDALGGRRRPIQKTERMR